MKARKSDQEYFKRLLERIKLIRTSERMFYQKITDIFAECSIDYDKNSDIAKEFYATVQNKFHYEVLDGKGKISAEKAKQKAENEYEKYKVIQDKKFVSDFDRLLNKTERIENN